MILTSRRRLGQWGVVFAREMKQSGWGGRLRVAWKVLKGGCGLLWQVALGRTVGRAEWRRRMRVCWGCPIYDRELKRCRPMDGHEFGCGCFVPVLALVRRPYPAGCWAREFLPGRGIGWE